MSPINIISTDKTVAEQCCKPFDQSFYNSTDVPQRLLIPDDVSVHRPARSDRPDSHKDVAHIESRTHKFPFDGGAEERIPS